MCGILTLGCTRFSPEFVTVVDDHRQLTTETNTTLIQSIQEEINSTSNAEKSEALEDLKERLEIISKQSEVIDKFVQDNLTPEQLAVLLSAKWK